MEARIYLCNVFRLKAYLTIILLAAGVASASAQERVWNAALDWYGYVCSKCAGWRDRIDRGESVPKDSLQLMLKELVSVRENLQEAWRDMGPRQRLRFEVIRDRFALGRWPGEVLSPVSLDGLPPALIRFADPGIAYEGRAGNVSDAKSHVRIGAVAGVTAGAYPDFSLGIIAGISLDPAVKARSVPSESGGWTLFVKARSNFHMRKTDYDCLSDGTAEGGYFWGGDGKTVNRHQVTLDFSYALTRLVSVYAGAGYGIRTLCWQDSDGGWARVTDRSHSGAVIDAGILIHPGIRGLSMPYATGVQARRLAFLAGCSIIPGSRYIDAEAGICWRF